LFDGKVITRMQELRVVNGNIEAVEIGADPEEDEPEDEHDS